MAGWLTDRTCRQVGIHAYTDTYTNTHIYAHTCVMAVRHASINA